METGEPCGKPVRQGPTHEEMLSFVKKSVSNLGPDMDSLTVVRSSFQSGKMTSRAKHAFVTSSGNISARIVHCASTLEKLNPRKTDGRSCCFFGSGCG